MTFNGEEAEDKIIGGIFCFKKISSLILPWWDDSWGFEIFQYFELFFIRMLVDIRMMGDENLV